MDKFMKFVTSTGGFKAFAWRIFAMLLFVAAIFVWPGAKDPFYRAFLAMFMMISAACILDYFDGASAK